MDNLITNIDNLLNLGNSDNLFDVFKDIAHVILNQTTLLVNNIEHEIVEIEFYLNSGTHKDMFTHKHTEYKTGQFRLHGAGIDIAIGGEGDGHGGILLRSIRSNDKLIEGPWKVATYLMQNMGAIDGASIALQKKENATKKIYYAPRVGLMLKKEPALDEQIKFLVNNYRYFTESTLQKEKYMIALANRKYHLGIDESNWDKPTLENYVHEFEKGERREVQLENIIKITPLVKAYLMGYVNNLNL